MMSGCLRRSRIVRASIVLSRTPCRLEFPRLRSRNQSRIPARHEYVLRWAPVFGRYISVCLPDKSRLTVLCKYRTVSYKIPPPKCNIINLMNSHRTFEAVLDLTDTRR